MRPVFLYVLWVYMAAVTKPELYPIVLVCFN